MSRRFRLAGKRIEPQFNVYNVTNANDILSLTTRYALPSGGSWLNATSVLPPRMVKFGIQVDF